jgi:hypothetical protein
MEGPTYNYIDYDTRDKTYDIYVPHAYQVLTVRARARRTRHQAPAFARRVRPASVPPTTSSIARFPR